MLQFKYYQKHIRGTAHRKKIVLERDFLCNIKPSLKNLLSTYSACSERGVFLSTKSLKHIHDRHIYDKGNTSDFLVILKNLTKIIRYPDEVRMDSKSKRGDFLFVKAVGTQFYFVSIQVDLDGNIDVVSCSATGEKYIKKFTLLWSWGTANPPS